MNSRTHQRELEGLTKWVSGLAAVAGIGLLAHVTDTLMSEELHSDPAPSVVEVALEDGRTYGGLGCLAVGGIVFLSRRKIATMLDRKLTEANNRLRGLYPEFDINSYPRTTRLEHNEYTADGIPIAPETVEGGGVVYTITTKPPLQPGEQSSY